MSTTYNDNHVQPLTMDDLTRTMFDFRARYGNPLKAVKVSDETLRWIEQSFPLYLSSETKNMLYGVPIQVDNDLPLFGCELIYD